MSTYTIQCKRCKGTGYMNEVTKFVTQKGRKHLATIRMVCHYCDGKGELTAVYNEANHARLVNKRSMSTARDSGDEQPEQSAYNVRGTTHEIVSINTRVERVGNYDNGEPYMMLEITTRDLSDPSAWPITDIYCLPSNAVVTLARQLGQILSKGTQMSEYIREHRERYS